MSQSLLETIKIPILGDAVFHLSCSPASFYRGEIQIPFEPIFKDKDVGAGGMIQWAKNLCTTMDPLKLETFEDRRISLHRQPAAAIPCKSPQGPLNISNGDGS